MSNYAKITIKLSEEEFDILERVADRNYRSPNGHASYVFHNWLRRAIRREQSTTQGLTGQPDNHNLLTGHSPTRA